MLLTVHPQADRAPTSDRRSSGVNRIGIVNDYVRIPYANGSSFASQFLYREFKARGHEVIVVGPDDPKASPEQMPERYVTLPSVPLRIHPGVQIPFPGREALDRIANLRLDVVVAQSNSGLLDLGVWLRLRHRVPFLCVNTIHLPSVYNVIVPDVLHGTALASEVFDRRVIPFAEQSVAQAFNRSDGLIVLSRGLERYWRDRGVTAPIFVIPRCVDPTVFDRHAADPFDVRARKGARLLVCCRHTREKAVDRLLSIFARWIAPRVPEATLTLVGDGPDHDAFRSKAESLGIAERCFFEGEQPLSAMPGYYRHADLFVYTSLSETYGQVIGEAMWCGLPVVAFDDGMGVAHQVVDGETGTLVAPGPDELVADARFGSEVVRLLRDAGALRAGSERAEAVARRRNAPERCLAAYYDAFAEAREHLAESLPAADAAGAARHLARWTGMHALLAGLGCLRPPVTVNRNGTAPQRWGGRAQMFSSEELAAANLVEAPRKAG